MSAWRAALRQGPRHRERLRAAARPRRRLRPGRLPTSPRSATAGPGSGPTASCASCGPRDRAGRGRRTSRTAEWFMDYRNADGSIAEMCGNGIRVFARYLVDAGLAAPGRSPDRHPRRGAHRRRARSRRQVTVDMGAARRCPRSAPVTVRVGGPQLARPRGADAATRTRWSSSTTSTTPGTCCAPARGRPPARSRTASTSSSSGRSSRDTSRCGCTSAASGETRSCGTGAVRGRASSPPSWPA